MKRIFKLIMLCTICALPSCNNYKKMYNEQIEKAEYVTKNYNNLLDSLDFYRTNYISIDSANVLRDSINIYKEDAILYKYKIERIKAYDNIIRNNSSQSKYFIGWVRRVLED